MIGWVATYDSEPNRTRALAGEVLRQAGLELEGRRVLEVGCGTGRNTAWLSERARSVQALDLSEGMLEKARAHVRSPSVELIVHDINAPWPIEAGAADVLIAMLVLEHIQDLAFVFAEAARVLRPGGELFSSELHPTRQMLGSQARFGELQTGGVEHVAAFPHDVSDYVNGAAAAGLTLVHLGEWRDAGAAFDVPPRILSGRYRRSPVR